jgi:hypothetical protein
MGDERVSRMAAVLVLAAGGEIRVPMRMIDQKHLIRLHQSSDPKTGDVIYRATPYDRAAAGPIVEGSSTIEHEPAMKRLN